MRRLLPLLLLALALALPQRAHAHASLVSSTPSAGASLPESPAELVLDFTEQIDPGFMTIRLLDSSGTVIVPGPGTLEEPARTRVRLALDAALPEGTYTIAWRVRSAIDGHVTEGSVPFGIGVAASDISLLPAPGAPEPATRLPTPPDALSRWMLLLSAALACGPLFFLALIWPTGADVPPVLRRLTLVGHGLFIAAQLLFLLAQSAGAAGVSLLAALGAPLGALIQSRTGALILARLALSALSAGLAWAWLRERTLPRWQARGLLLIAALIALTISLGSHGAALPEGSMLAIGLDWLHMLAFLAWIGGLAPLLVVLRPSPYPLPHEGERASPPTPLPHPGEGRVRGGLPAGPRGRERSWGEGLLARFSRLAMAAVAVLTLTGIYSAVVHIGGLALLPATTYGRALLIKLVLFAALLLLGGLNQWVLIPQLAGAAGRMLRRLQTSVRVELAAAALVLLAVGVMTSVAPSAIAWEEQQQIGVKRVIEQDQVTMTLWIVPAQVGDNEFAIDVRDERPGAAEVPGQVFLRFLMLDVPLGVVRTEATSTDQLRYTARGNFLTVAGSWNIEVLLRRPGMNDVRESIVISVPERPSAAAE